MTPIELIKESVQKGHRVVIAMESNRPFYEVTLSTSTYKKNLIIPKEDISSGELEKILWKE